jgi:hypothetical protein
MYVINILIGKCNELIFMLDNYEEQLPLHIYTVIFSTTSRAGCRICFCAKQIFGENNVQVDGIN